MSTTTIALTELTSVPTGERFEQVDDHASNPYRSEESALEGGNTGFAALPPVDGGREAWLFLFAAFMVETLVWGLPFSVGVLHQYWTTVLFPSSAASSLLTLSATLQTGLMYCSVIVYGPLLQRYPQHRAKMQATGLFASVCGILGSAFVTKPWHLTLTVGVLYPLGGTVFYMPAPTLIFEWFQAKRGVAAGVVYAGTGIGGASFPFIMQSLIDHIGYRWGLVALAIGYGILGSIALAFIKPRVPVAQSRVEGGRNRPRMDRSFIYRSSFYAFGGAILFTSLGNFVPSIYLPAYASDLGLKTNDGTMLVTVMNAASVPGILLLGHLSDRLPLRVVILLSCLGSALACLFLWGFATSVVVLVVFSVTFGFLGLSFSGVWAALITNVAKNDPHLPATLFTLFTFARGIGNIVSGPISDSLLTHNKLGGASFGYGVDNYGSLLLYTGLMMVIGSAVGMAYKDTE